MIAYSSTGGAWQAQRKTKHKKSECLFSCTLDLLLDIRYCKKHSTK